ncbi:hypothetical protein EIK77_002859 [Talaromyces pinophilus]|nr:hypothetical protein EIK77_002859 [Talaromyces pinophilus]
MSFPPYHPNLSSNILKETDPIIFRGLKSLILQDPQQKSLLRLAQEGISVYSPHTAVDAVPGGMADWLCDIVCGKFVNSSSSTTTTTEKSIGGGEGAYSDVVYPQPASNTTTPSVDAHTREPVHPSPAPVPTGFEGAGAGRTLTFATPQPLATIIERIGAATGSPGSISVAIPQGQSVSSINIRTVGVCPGSGGGVLMKGGPLPDLLFTGELSHHEALAAIERGSSVVTLFHSNSERGYLWDVMRQKLEDGIVQELSITTTKTEGGLVAVSKADRDPFGVVVRK